jgi:hypothetical protein
LAVEISNFWSSNTWLSEVSIWDIALPDWQPMVPRKLTQTAEIDISWSADNLLASSG